MKSVSHVACIGVLALGGCVNPPRIEVSADRTQIQVNGALTVPSGVPLKLGFFTRANPDCTQGDIPVVRAGLEPAHGKLQFVETEDFPKFAATGTFAKCNTKRFKGIRAVYTPDAGYVGKDEYIIEVFFSGRVVRSHALVNVL